MNSPRFTRYGIPSSFKLISVLTITLTAMLILTALELSLRKVGAQPSQNDLTISTIAGGGFGSNVTAKQAPMTQPTGVVFDPQGRGFYVVDELDGTNLLRFVNTGTAALTLSGVTIQPNSINLIGGGGTSTNDNINPRDTDLAEISALAVDPTGDAIYLAIPGFSAIRVINVGTQSISVLGKSVAPATITTIASLGFGNLRGMAVHPATRELYFIADRLVLKIDNNGTQTVFAGGGTPSTGLGDGGPANRALLITPLGLAFDNNNNLLIADGGDARNIQGNVRRVVDSGTISSLASGLEFPVGITTVPNGDAFVALGNAQQVVRITTSGAKTIVAGNQKICDMASSPTCGDNGPALQASLNLPDSTTNRPLTLAATPQGFLIPDFRFKRVRYVNPTNEAISIAGTNVAPQTINTVVGSGIATPFDDTPATSAELSGPTGVAIDSAGNLFISDTRNNRLRFINRTSAPVTLFASKPFATTVQPGRIVTLNRNAGDEQVDNRITTAVFLSPQGLATTSNGVLIVDSQAGALIKIPPNSIQGRRSGVIEFLNTSGSDVTFFPNGGDAKVVIAPGEIKVIAGVRPPDNPQSLGDGMTANRVAFFPTDVALDSGGNLYIADQGNNRIRRIDASSGVVSTAYGDGTQQTLFGPTGIAFGASGRLHIADTRNNRIIRQNQAGGADFSVIATSTQKVNRPRDLTVDSAGKVYFTNALTHQVIQLDAPSNSAGTTTVIAGNGQQGFSGDEGLANLARLNLPNPGTASNDIQLTTNIITLADGEIAFADTRNNRIRLLKRRTSAPAVSVVSAASFAGSDVASESISAAFGQRLATGQQGASSTPLPTSLLNTTVIVRDSTGSERAAPLFYVSPAQVNLQIPAGTAIGPAQITATSGDGSVSIGSMNIAAVGPGLFTASSNGQGVAAAVVLRIKPNNQQSFEAVARFDSAQNKFVPVAIDLGPQGDQLFLVLFGTGFRFRGGLPGVSATIGGVNAEVLYAGPADGFVGLDQSNVRIPRELAGRGVVNVTFTVDGKPANTINIQIK